MIHASVTAVLVMCIGFSVFHDASHFAIYAGKNSHKNEVLARLVGAMLMWH